MRLSKVGNTIGVCLKRSHFDGFVIGAIIEPGCMKKCVSPEFNTKSGCIQHTSNPFFKCSMGTFDDDVGGKIVVGIGGNR